MKGLKGVWSSEVDCYKNYKNKQFCYIILCMGYKFLWYKKWLIWFTPQVIRSLDQFGAILYSFNAYQIAWNYKILCRFSEIFITFFSTTYMHWLVGRALVLHPGSNPIIGSYFFALFFCLSQIYDNSPVRVKDGTLAELAVVWYDKFRQLI